MEKKASQPSSKGNGTESKKSQDAPNGKQFPKSARKREVPGSNGPRSDQNRKPARPKSKSFRKQPKPRGMHYSSGKEGPQVECPDLDLEFGSFNASGKKEVNLNHLLNFHYEHHGNTVPGGRVPRTPQSYSTKALMATHAHKYNKEQFLQANCQFVVRSCGDFSPYLADPDLLVDWSLVELIKVSSFDTVSCPICLYPPVAAKITRCGHIFCWTCILHYLALSDKTWRKCPICYESVHKTCLKSVECSDRKQYSVGQKITLQLMKREKGSMIYHPVPQYETRLSKPILHLSDQELPTVYSKLLLATRDDISKILDKEYSELLTQVEEFTDCPELCFVEQALDLLSKRREQLSELQDIPVTFVSNSSNTFTDDDFFSGKRPANMCLPPLSLATPPKMSEVQSSPSEESLQEKMIRNDSTSSESDDFGNVKAEDLQIASISQSCLPVKYFYFYQAIDGQHIYAHAINIKMLEMTYGSLENCPHEVTATIVEKEVGSMTAELRTRLRYMQHLPITCEFEVVELAFEQPLVSEEAMMSFEDQLKQRKRRRVRRAREEKQREKNIQAYEKRQFGLGPFPDLPIESHFHFPQCGSANAPLDQRPPSTKSSRASSPDQSETRGRQSPITSAMAALSFDHDQTAAAQSSEAVSNRPTFAQVGREGGSFNSKPTWPVSSEVSRSKQRQPSVTLDSDTELYALSPPARHCFNIAEALEKAAQIEKDSGEAKQGGKKKKKKSQKVLFSTGMSCPGN